MSQNFPSYEEKLKEVEELSDDIKIRNLIIEKMKKPQLVYEIEISYYSNEAIIENIIRELRDCGWRARWEKGKWGAKCPWSYIKISPPKND